MTATTEQPVMTVAEAYEACAAVTRAASSNFYYAMQTLDRDRRNAIFAAYAFCRLCDDIVDEPERRATAKGELAEVRSNLSATFRGEAPPGAIWTALADAHRRYGLYEAHLADVAEGCMMDLTKTSYSTFAELEVYCRKVASAVGLTVIEICGYSDGRAIEHAIDLGIGTQLTNIIRDLAEDVGLGRIYLPQEDLTRYGYSAAEMAGSVRNEAFVALMTFQADRARRYFESGEKLFPYLDRRSRACPETIYLVYRKLLDRMESGGFDVFSGRAGLSRGDKISLALRLWIRSRTPFLS